MSDFSKENKETGTVGLNRQQAIEVRRQFFAGVIEGLYEEARELPEEEWDNPDVVNAFNEIRAKLQMPPASSVMRNFLEAVFSNVASSKAAQVLGKSELFQGIWPGLLKALSDSKGSVTKDSGKTTVRNMLSGCVQCALACLNPDLPKGDLETVRKIWPIIIKQEIQFSMVKNVQILVPDLEVTLNDGPEKL